jgi:uncharacterized protein (DUF697 family)
MADDDTEIQSRRIDTLGKRTLGSGRLGTYTVLGGVTGIVPLPWIPDRIAKRIRGALVHDLTSRHGLSLTPEARNVLVEPGGAEGPKGLVSQGITFAVTRVLGRFGPFAAVAPVRTALGTFVLGHLLQRYLDGNRSIRAVRIDVEEARKVRRAIDQALLYALTTEPRTKEEVAIPPEDLRDQTTQIVDGVIISMANLPGWFVRRLDAAFDEVLSTVRA